MPLTYITKLAGRSSSNKQKTTSEKHLVKYWYEVDGWGKVNVLQPFIDKITITVPVDAEDKQQIIRHHLLQLIKDENEPQFQGLNASQSRYKFAIDCISPANGEIVRFDADPKQPQKLSNFIRLEFNPVSLTAEGLAAFKDQLEYMTAGTVTWNDVVAQGRATRIDIATDLVNAPTEQLIVLSTLGGKSHFYVSEKGDLETAYVGLKKAGKASEQKGYNKLQEAIDTASEPHYEAIYHSRIEISVKGTTQKLVNVPSLKNPFERVMVIHPGEQPPCGVDPVIWRLFLDVCRFRGIESAAELLPPPISSICKKRLSDLGDKCWRTSKLWESWPNLISKTGLLKEN